MWPSLGGTAGQEDLEREGNSQLVFCKLHNKQRNSVFLFKDISLVFFRFLAKGRLNPLLLSPCALAEGRREERELGGTGDQTGCLGQLCALLPQVFPDY